MTYKKATAQSSSELECSECGEECYMCENCREYFNDEDDIYCEEDEYGNKHYCIQCKPKKKGVLK